MSKLQIFENPEFGQIRSVEIDGEPWLVGKDVAAALGYSDTNQALRKHVDDEDKLTRRFDGEPNPKGGNPNMTIINESGLYSLILSSKLPSAKKFKRWVTSEVLPSIRKTGGYLPAAEKTLADLTAAVQLLTERLDVLAEAPALPGQVSPPEKPRRRKRPPGIAAQRRWMRTASEKLDLMQARLGLPHNILLSQIYHIMEEKSGAVLEDERLQVMEEKDLSSCSILTAVFYRQALKEMFQDIVDYNLAPENQGW